MVRGKKMGNVLKKSDNFKSNLERFCNKQLKETDWEYCYECKKFTIFDKFKYKNDCWERIGKTFKPSSAVRAITYTPDFIVKDKYIIEVKGHFTQTARIKWKLFKKHLIESGEDYIIFMPRSQKEIKHVINLIENYEKDNRKNRRVVKRSPKRKTKVKRK